MTPGYMKPCKNQILQFSLIFMTPGTWNLAKIRSFNFFEFWWPGTWNFTKTDASIFSNFHNPGYMKICTNQTLQFSLIFMTFKKVTIWLKTCFWPWSRAKSKKLRALLLVQLLNVANGGHFQDSKFMIWLKHAQITLLVKSRLPPFINEKFRKWFHFFTGILSNYVPQESYKEFKKNIVIFKTWELVSFWGDKTHFGKLSMKWCIYRHTFFLL